MKIEVNKTGKGNTFSMMLRRMPTQQVFKFLNKELNLNSYYVFTDEITFCDLAKPEKEYFFSDYETELVTPVKFYLVIED